METTSKSPLPCGRDAAQLWQSAQRPATKQEAAHEAQCPHCRAWKAAAARIQPLVETYTDSTEFDPGAHAPGLKARVMDIARTEVRRGRAIPVQAHSGLDVSVSEEAIKRLARSAADSVPGVRTRRVAVKLDDAAILPAQGRPRPSPVAAVDVPTLRIKLHVVVSPRTSYSSVDVSAKAAVSEVLSRVVGVNVAAVDVLVEDVYET